MEAVKPIFLEKEMLFLMRLFGIVNNIFPIQKTPILTDPFLGWVFLDYLSKKK